MIKREDYFFPLYSQAESPFRIPRPSSAKGQRRWPTTGVRGTETGLQIFWKYIAFGLDQNNTKMNQAHFYLK